VLELRKKRTLLNDFKTLMKKVGSILLLLVFLFNAIGYKAIFLYMEQEADTRIEAKIKTLDELDSRLIAVKIPINLPYQTDWREFESVDGEMTFKGKTYKYVKRKVILLFIDHKEKSEIQKSSDDYFKKVNDLASETNKKPLSKQSKTDYYQELNDFKALIFVAIHLDQNCFNYTPRIAYGYPQKVKAPPKKYTA
jgi:hypothetical protein